MKKGLFFLAIIFSLFSCKKSVSIQKELMEGAWLFQKVENNNGEIILDGNGTPELYVFFVKNNRLTGKFTGEYTITDDKLYLQAVIDSIAYGMGFQDPYVLDSFPQRYYDFQNITKNGINGQVEFIENGWDSQFIYNYAPDRKMWFIRY